MTRVTTRPRIGRPPLTDYGPRVNVRLTKRAMQRLRRHARRIPNGNLAKALREVVGEGLDAVEAAERLRLVVTEHADRVDEILSTPGEEGETPMRSKSTSKQHSAAAEAAIARDRRVRRRADQRLQRKKRSTSARATPSGARVRGTRRLRTT